MADGKGCVCHAYGECECACGADWTPQEVYDLRAEVELAKSESRKARKRTAELNAEVERLREAVNAVFDLIEESHGVTGLHLNGDVAPWDELLRGGRYEDWLAPLSDVAKKGM